MQPPGGVARTKSVNSYKAFQPLPEDKQAQLAEALSDEAVLTAKMDGVVEILQVGEGGAAQTERRGQAVRWNWGGMAAGY